MSGVGGRGFQRCGPWNQGGGIGGNMGGFGGSMGGMGNTNMRGFVRNVGGLGNNTNMGGYGGNVGGIGNNSNMGGFGGNAGGINSNTIGGMNHMGMSSNMDRNFGGYPGGGMDE